MSRIKLRQLIYLTEQAPQPAPPMADPLSPTEPGADASQPEEPSPAAPTPDTSPEPEDPGEYDFTKDFRAFEDKKNKAEADAKKVLLDKMNEKLLNKTIVANASRGYGQPKTDYTIKSVKKVSVEFWYKDYVVIVADENDKKYFLTPGINIKIESSGSEPAPGGEEQPQADQGLSAGSVDGQEEAPNGTPPVPETPKASPQPATTGGQPPVGQPEQPEEEPQGVVPTTDANPTAPQTMPVNPKKKKKVVPPVAEWVQNDLDKFLLEFMSDTVKNENGRVDFTTYIKESSKMLAEGLNVTKIKVKLLIPESHMLRVDGRDIKLAAVDAMRQKSYSGKYAKGSIEINKTGRYYLLEYTKEIGWNI